MKHPRPAPPRRAKRGPGSEGTAPLLAAFRKIHILHYAAEEPIHPLSILEKFRARYCSMGAAALNRILVRMARNGWLKCARPRGTSRLALPAYTLTSKGRQALHLARKRLKDLACGLGDK